MRGTSLQIGSAVLVAAAACSGPGGTEAGVPELPGLLGGVRVLIDQGRGGQGGDAGTEVHVSARFLRFREVDPTTAAVLAGGEPAAPEGCHPPGPGHAVDDLLDTLPDAARIEHLDAGEISVVWAGVAVSTTPTRLPALSPWVDGVEYAEQVAGSGPVSRSADAISGPDGPDAPNGPASPAPARGDEVGVTGVGGQHVGPFEALLAVPVGRPLALVEPDLVVTWSMPAGEEARPLAGDEVVLRVAGPTGPICRVADAGLVRVPAAMLPARGTLSIEIERIRRTPLGAPGLPTAELELVVRDVLSVWRP